tara:strand:- start:14443 stop:14589 length:147 start_codon:yes stop_codon:yes gene_type:complete
VKEPIEELFKALKSLNVVVEKLTLALAHEEEELKRLTNELEKLKKETS